MEEREKVLEKKLVESERRFRETVREGKKAEVRELEKEE